MWLLADIMRTGMFLAGVVLLVMILVRRTYRYHGRRRPNRKATEPHLTQAPRPVNEHRSLSTAPPDVLSWHVEMHETAREMKAELDSKMRVLQLLIAQASHEADRMEQILSRLDSSADELPDDPPPKKRLPQLPGSADRQAEIFVLADLGRTAAEIAQQVETPVGEVELILSLRGT